MKTIRNLKRRSGFTLVELLIVIIIIGILAGAMMMLAGSGTDRAEATKIISDLRGLKAAALMYYADNPTVTVLSADEIALLRPYMDRDISGYSFESGTSSDWYVGRKALPNSGLRGRLGSSAAESALLGAKNPATTYVDQDQVWMVAR